MIDLLESVTVFKNLDIDELQLIRKATKQSSYKDSELIFQEGEPANFCYVVVAGKVQLNLSVTIYNSTELLTIDSIEEKELFGWSAFVKPQKYTLSALADGKVKLFKMDSRKILAYCNSNPALGFKLMTSLSTVIADRFSKLQQSLQNYIGNTLAEKY